MEGGMRSGENSSIVVKNRTSSGCLIVRKKSDGSGGVGSSGTRPFFKSKKDNKRPRVVMSDSGSSDELLMPYRSRIRPDTMQVCNGLGVYGKGITGEAEVSRKRMREERFSQSEDGFVRRNGHRLGVSKKNMLDVYDFDEYDRIEEEVLPKGKRFEYKDKHFEDRKLLSSVHRKVSSFERDRDSGPSRHVIIEGRKKNLYPDKNSRLNGDGSSSFRKGRDASHPPLSLSRERYVDSEEPIRVQGKNGVLKLMVNKNKRIGPPLKNFDHLEVEKGRNGLRVENNVRRSMQASPFHMEAEVAEKRDSVMKLDKKQKKLLTSASAMKSKVSDSDSEAGDRSLRVKPNNGESSKLLKKTSRKVEKMQDECTPLTAKIKEGKGKRGCGTEKQKLREKIRGMLLDAGWTIDYRPRRNRDYLDAVYINPSGTAYWSIIKAYDALLKQLNDEETENQNCADGSALAPLPDEVLSQLTRKTRKKMEQEMKKKDVKEAGARKSSIRDEDESMDSLSHEEKLSSFIKQGKLLKSRTNGSENVNLGSKSQGSILHLHNSEKPSPVSNSRIVQGRKIKNIGRCILLVRNSEGLNLEDDGFVPYSGKRTILSWLIDSGAVHLSQKVQYMNRRRSRVMLEGWVTGDGIHCGCCSKILTVSKFEIHAGSKLRQPFQNIYLDSGVSLLQCQMDAWNRLEKSERIGFRSIDIDGEDPNDDTCGICGDGGDLICCDGCPSTYHLSCLSIDYLPAGDWHCPKCTCKFCGVGGDFVEEEDENNSLLLTCSLCEKRYHNLCVKEIHSLQVDSSGLVIYFCEQKCKELFEHLQKMLGVKCELEAGFSWSLVRRIDTDVDTFIRGLQQKVECNSKLAVALNVMDECFLPIIDRRSGTNLIHNVLYNCGREILVHHLTSGALDILSIVMAFLMLSNFNRLNYSGFYTAILERGDEIISAASLRFHGTQVAEMPFIGTRHIYRHQGMCRRLFSAIESALSSLKVEKLVIPAIAELTHTWTSAFGFTPLEEKLKEALRFLNMLVFPGIDMLQKLLMMQENAEADMTAGKELLKSELKHCNISKAAKIPERESKSDSDSSSGHDVSGNAISLEASLEHNASLSADATSGDTESMKKMNDYSPDNNCLFNNDTHHGVLVSNNPVPGSPTDDNTFSCTDDETKDAGVVSHAESKTLLAVNRTECDVSELRDGVPESFDGKELCSFSVSHKLVGIENKLRLESPTKEFMGSGEGHIGAAQEQDNNVSASDEVKTQCVGDQTSCTISRSGQRLTGSPENCLVSPDASPNALNGESKMVLDAGDESDLQSKGSDASDIDGNGIDDTAGPHDPEMQVLVQESMNAASDTGDMLLDSASDRNFRPVDTDLDRMEGENTAVLDPYARHFTRSIDNIACHESTSSSRGTVTGISIDESDEYAGISAGYHSDLHDQVNLEDDKKYATDRD